MIVNYHLVKPPVIWFSGLYHLQYHLNDHLGSSESGVPPNSHHSIFHGFSHTSPLKIIIELEASFRGAKTGVSHDVMGVAPFFIAQETLDKMSQRIEARGPRGREG
jgi:hypothetical protein